MKPSTKNSMEQWLRTLALYVGLVTSGFMFHEKIIADIDVRIQKIQTGFSVQSGEDLKLRVGELDQRLNERINKVEQDIKDFLKHYGAGNS